MTRKDRIDANTTDVDSLATRVREWIASDEGFRALSEALEEAGEATSLLEKDCRVTRESLHEPVTL